MKATTEEVEAKDKLQKVLHDNEDKLTDRDEDGNPGYVYTDANGKQKMAILVRSEEDVKVKNYKGLKPKKEKKAKDSE